MHRLVILLSATRPVGRGKVNVDSYSNIFKVGGKDTSLHPRFACCVTNNYHNVKGIPVILNTVGGHPNQGTHPNAYGSGKFLNCLVPPFHNGNNTPD
jgi:hypothetical protein